MSGVALLEEFEAVIADFERRAEDAYWGSKRVVMDGFPRTGDGFFSAYNAYRYCADRLKEVLKADEAAREHVRQCEGPRDAETEWIAPTRYSGSVVLYGNQVIASCPKCGRTWDVTAAEAEVKLADVTDHIEKREGAGEA